MKLDIEFDRIEAVNLQPGDVIVVTVPEITDADQVHFIKISMENVFPGHEVVVKTNDVMIDIFNNECA